MTLNYSLSGCPLCSNFVSGTPWTLFSFIYVTLSENAYFGLAWKSGRRWHIFFLPGSLGVPMCPQSRGVATLSLIQWAGREMTSPFKRVLDSPPAVNTPIESMFSSYLCWKRGYRCKHKYSHTNGKGHLELMFTTNKNVCGLYMSNVLRNRNLWCDVGWLYLGWMGHTLTKGRVVSHIILLRANSPTQTFTPRLHTAQIWEKSCTSRPASAATRSVLR